ncbi:MAG: hypothetical protein ABJC63_16360 [Gemmatimonadales bacterium]
MTSPEFLSVALSFVLGLAVTLLITSFLCAFLERRATKFDWLPFVWALYILAYQFDYWWESFQLIRAPGITMMAFGCLLVLALTLSFSGGLVLPSNIGKYPADLADYFERDGRWGILGLGFYNVVGTLANKWLFNLNLVSGVTLVNLVSVALVCVTVFSRSRRLQVTSTLAFGLNFIVFVTLYVPKSYQG